MNSGPVLIGLAGTELDEHSRKLCCHPAVGGVVLFTRNFSNCGQLERLVSDIHSLRNPRLLVCIDQEGGRVQRLKDGFTQLPALAVLGSLHDSDPDKAVDMAYRHGRVMATEMLACGIDLSFAPVLDINRGSCVIGDRALSAKPETVSALGRAYLAGMHDAGMKTTGKHFPGHGSVVADSHVDDVTDPRGLDEIEQSDLVPFRELAGELDAMMIAHVVYPQVDRLPAGYSRIWLSGYLRGFMEYQGVILSDDLGMHAAKTAGDLAARTRKCLDAGCDLVLICQPDDVEELLGETDGPIGDASCSIRKLYGMATVDRDELSLVKEAGIREWQQWRNSLEKLGEQSWS
jgi:beta-N-acetylhexosaminidase